MTWFAQQGSAPLGLPVQVAGAAVRAAPAGATGCRGRRRGPHRVRSGAPAATEADPEPFSMAGVPRAEVEALVTAAGGDGGPRRALGQLRSGVGGIPVCRHARLSSPRAGTSVRSLLDATALPENHGGVGRYVDEILARLPGLGVDAHVLAQPRDRARYASMLGDDRVHLAPGWAAGAAPRLAWEQSGLPLVVRRVAAGRAALAALHDAAGHQPRDDAAAGGHAARRDLLQPPRAAPRRQGALLPRLDPAVGAAGRRAHRAERGDPVRGRAAHRRRPGPDHRHPARRRPRPVPAGRPPTRRPGYASGSASRPARPTSPSSARWSRARTCRPWSGRMRVPAASAPTRRRWSSPAARAGTTASTRPSPTCRPTSRCSGPGFVPDDLVPGLLGGAEVVAYPAFGEGFGLPVLEAMACGAAVLTTAGALAARGGRRRGPLRPQPGRRRPRRGAHRAAGRPGRAAAAGRGRRPPGGRVHLGHGGASSTSRSTSGWPPR